MFLALSAAFPELAPSAVTIGQAAGSSSGRPRLSTFTLGPLAGGPEVLRSEALTLLDVLVDLYQRGMREPLPMYCATSAAWATARSRDENPYEPSRTQWASAFDDFPGEDSEPEHLAVLGAAVTFDQVLECPAGVEETGRGWATTESTQFGRLAMRLWGPVLRRERPREH
jgi:exodeoxyribonuclease V gamma subunit